MKNHEQCAALLDAYIDGALSDGDAARVRGHLEECPDCRAYVSDALVMRELFPGIEETPVPEGFGDSVLSALPAQKVLWRTQWKKIALPLAACVAVVLLARGVFYNPATKGADSASEMSAAGAETAVMDGGGVLYAESVEAAAPMESATLYGAASEWDENAEDAAELETAAVTSDSGAALKNASAKSAADSGAKSRNAASDETDAAPETPLAASLYAVDDADTMPPAAPEPSDAYRATSETTVQRDVSAPSAVAGAAPDTNAVTESASPDAGGVGESASTDTDAAAESASPDAEEPATDTDAVTESASPDTDAVEEETGAEDTADASEEAELLAGSLSVTVSVWTLAANAAPIMERYPPDAVTDSGKWYVMTAAEFDALCERFPDMEITSGPETVAASSLPDGAPQPAISEAVYLFAPIGES